jgi:hypothetical protein
MALDAGSMKIQLFSTGGGNCNKNTFVGAPLAAAAHRLSPHPARPPALRGLCATVSWG